ncbi:tyrosine-protein phosphatase [Rhodococcus artemisiae]|uniref:Tyrosine-protein phosphatase n=1 Tax=Rhodococcus artemisiae TaxID=714159 RepID=A0ABU7L5D7_9NOCA|nr:tyrosine-protein phosphatase [Rhodococcus artemisiae]MEE2056754.1 tyrosine-protein phosphatase [Rhodococcus artemisiae]
MTITTVDISLSIPANLRDMGGIRIAGGVLRAGLVIRADDLSTIPEETARDLVEGGLVSVIDLRSTDEVALTGRGVLAGHPVAYHHLPLMADIGQGMSGLSKDASSSEGAGPSTFSFDHVQFGTMYADMVERAAPQLASALSIISLAPGATAFHCTAGRDRTGVLASLLLHSLGAGDDDIVADYALTDTNMAGVHSRTHAVMSVLMTRIGFDLDDIAASTITNEPSDISMITMLAVLRERHGDPLAPLRAAGLGDDVVARLRERARAA